MVGIGVWFAIKNSSPTLEETTSYGATDKSRSLFHRYTNFLIDGKDSNDKSNLTDFLANNYSLLYPEAMFAEQIKFKDPESARAYLNDLNSIYTEFSQTFFSPDSDISEDSKEAISNYFSEAAKGSYLNLDQIISLYIQEGKESVRNMLTSTFKSESSDEIVKSLLEARKKQMDLYLEATIQADQAGCIVDGLLEVNCALPYFEVISAEDAELSSLINGLEIQLRRIAIASLENIYYTFYPEEKVIERVEI